VHGHARLEHLSGEVGEGVVAGPDDEAREPFDHERRRCFGQECSVGTVRAASDDETTGGHGDEAPDHPLGQVGVDGDDDEVAVVAIRGTEVFGEDGERVVRVGARIADQVLDVDQVQGPVGVAPTHRTG
jgi:hypothetical protein